MGNKRWVTFLGLGLALTIGCEQPQISDLGEQATFEDAGRVAWRGDLSRAGDDLSDIMSALAAAKISPVRAPNSSSDLSAYGLMLVDRQTDELGNTHFKLAQRVGGVQVEGAGLTVSMRGDAVYAVLGKHFSAEGARTEHPVAWAAAIERALGRAALSREELSATPEINLVLQWQDGRLVSRLRVDLRTDMTAPRTYVDAVSGEISAQYDLMHHDSDQSNGAVLGTDEHSSTNVALQTFEDNGTWYLRDTSRNNGSDYARTIRTYDVDQCGSGTSLCGGEARSENNTWAKAHNNSAHFLTGQVLDFWNHQYGLDSYDNHGASLRVFQLQTSGYDNAYWNGIDSIVIGDGSFNGTSGYYDYLSRADIIAHEMGHAVEGALGPDLLYRQESGALSEATADMTAAFFERWHEGELYGVEGSDWLIGEDTINAGSNYPYRAMRNMADPNEMGDPDTWRGRYWAQTEGCSPSASNDNCGVHTNSGPANYAFYLQVEGGEGVNDFGLAYDVAPMGMEAAHAVMFQAMRYHLTEGAGYQDYFDALTTAVDELYGAGSDEARCVEDSLNAVGLRVCGNNACEAGEDADSCSADCDGSNTTPEPTPEPTPAPAQADVATFVSDINVDQRTQSRISADVISTVSVRHVDTQGSSAIAPGAWVTLSISDSTGAKHVVEGSTDHEGKLTIIEYKMRKGTTVEVCVLNVENASSPYDPALNAETCVSHRVTR